MGAMSLPLVGYTLVREEFLENAESYRVTRDRLDSEKFLLRMARAAGFTEEAVSQMAYRIKEGVVAHAPPF